MIHIDKNAKCNLNNINIIKKLIKNDKICEIILNFRQNKIQINIWIFMLLFT